MQESKEKDKKIEKYTCDKKADLLEEYLFEDEWRLSF